MNKVFMTGMVASNPVLRVEEGDIPHLVFHLSVRHKVRSGETRSEIYRISAWNYAARWGAEHLQHGQLMGVQGYLTQRKLRHELEILFVPEVVAEEFFPMRQAKERPLEMAVAVQEAMNGGGGKG